MGQSAKSKLVLVLKDPENEKKIEKAFKVQASFIHIFSFSYIPLQPRLMIKTGVDF